MEFFRHARYEVADFYAGLIFSTLDIEVRQDLQDCMVTDHELVQVWDKAIRDISHGREERWERHFQMALDVSPHDLEACSSNGKLRTVGRQIDTWWDSFWSQEDASEILEFNYREHPFKVGHQVGAMRIDWELGYYYDAGKRFGNVWNLLIGKPEWQQPEEFLPSGPQRYPLADFYAGSLENLFNVNYAEEL